MLSCYHFSRFVVSKIQFSRYINLQSEYVEFNWWERHTIFWGCRINRWVLVRGRAWCRDPGKAERRANIRAQGGWNPAAIQIFFGDEAYGLTREADYGKCSFNIRLRGTVSYPHRLCRFYHFFTASQNRRRRTANNGDLHVKKGWGGSEERETQQS